MSGSWRSKEKIFKDFAEDGSLERWARAGATDKQMAENLGMSRDTFYKYLREYPDTLDSIQRARKPVVLEAFEGLVRLSRGFHETKTTTHTYVVYRRDKNGEMVEKERVEKTDVEDVYFPPDHKAGTKVIVNYLKHMKKNREGVPTEYVNEPEVTIEMKQGRLPEMEDAMKELFFGGGDDDVES